MGTNGRQFLAQFFDENEPWLLVGISNSSDQHMKKLMAQREGLCVTLIMERTHDENIHDRIKHVFFVRGTVCRWNIQKMHSESNTFVSRTTGFFTNGTVAESKLALESYLDEHATEV